MTAVASPLSRCQAAPVQVYSNPVLVFNHCWPMKSPSPVGVDPATITAELSDNFIAVTPLSIIFAVVTALSKIFTEVIALFAMVVANAPVPVPVTSPERVIVWSPVLVPVEVPEKLPFCVASVPRPSVVRMSATLASSRMERAAEVQGTSSTTPPQLDERPNSTSVEDVS